jgi:hypothetical protein
MQVQVRIGGNTQTFDRNQVKRILLTGRDPANLIESVAQTRPVLTCPDQIGGRVSSIDLVIHLALRYD